MWNPDIPGGRDPIRLVVQTFHDLPGALVAMRAGKNFTYDERSISHDGCMHALQDIGLEILDIDFH
jgi:hypothetical protein